MAATGPTAPWRFGSAGDRSCRGVGEGSCDSSGRHEFSDGERFYTRAGRVIALPDRKHREFLEWHRGEVFKAS
jgi:hypothetical protein